MRKQDRQSGPRRDKIRYHFFRGKYRESFADTSKILAREIRHIFENNSVG